MPTDPPHSMVIASTVPGGNGAAARSSTPPPDRFSVIARTLSEAPGRPGSSLAWAIRLIGTRTALRRCMRRGPPTTSAV